MPISYAEEYRLYTELWELSARIAVCLGALFPADGEATGGEAHYEEHSEVHDEGDDADIGVGYLPGRKGNNWPMVVPLTVT